MALIKDYGEITDFTIEGKAGTGTRLYLMKWLISSQLFRDAAGFSNPGGLAVMWSS